MNVFRFGSSGVVLENICHFACAGSGPELMVFIATVGSSDTDNWDVTIRDEDAHRFLEVMDYLSNNKQTD